MSENIEPSTDATAIPDGWILVSEAREKFIPGAKYLSQETGQWQHDSHGGAWTCGPEPVIVPQPPPNQ